ncbi:MAG: hypothetical protein MK078_15405 [Crocinitomicaceae bacterium]|nr:hypothetical protein [Crocinitomicaceae bacterium]
MKNGIRLGMFFLLRKTLRNLILGITLLLVFSCSRESGHKGMSNETLYGCWIDADKEGPSEETSFLDYRSVSCYWEDSTFFDHHGDYSDDGVYFVDDSILTKITIRTNRRDTFSYRIISVGDTTLSLSRRDGRIYNYDRLRYSIDSANIVTYLN